jgi:SAM-dependent methyltransferase
MSLSLSKVANVLDFKDPNFQSIFGKYGIADLKTCPFDDPSFTNRKTWEIGMVIHSFDHFGVLNGSNEFLGIGVAKEQTISVLSNHSKRVFATDIYLDQGTWGDWHNKGLLIDARPHMDSSYNHKKVVWQHVDGRELPYEDNSFEGIFSCSSIEHFGDESDIRRAIREIYRVLKPNGIAALSSEYKISGDGNNFHNVQLFDRDRFERVWLSGLDWIAVDFLDEQLDDTPFVDFERSIKDKKYRKTANPHIKLDNGKFKWTSVHLTLQKNKG